MDIIPWWKDTDCNTRLGYGIDLFICLQETYLVINNKHQFIQNIFQAIISRKQACIAIVASNKTDYTQKLGKRDKSLHTFEKNNTPKRCYNIKYIFSKHKGSQFHKINATKPKRLTSIEWY